MAWRAWEGYFDSTSFPWLLSGKDNFFNFYFANASIWHTMFYELLLDERRDSQKKEVFLFLSF